MASRRASTGRARRKEANPAMSLKRSACGVRVSLKGCSSAPAAKAPHMAFCKDAKGPACCSNSREMLDHGCSLGKVLSATDARLPSEMVGLEDASEGLLCGTLPFFLLGLTCA
eukprot:2475303-Amphidinium_carterae.1